MAAARARCTRRGWATAFRWRCCRASSPAASSGAAISTAGWRSAACRRCRCPNTSVWPLPLALQACGVRRSRHLVLAQRRKRTDTHGKGRGIYIGAVLLAVFAVLNLIVAGQTVGHRLRAGAVGRQDRDVARRRPRGQRVLGPRSPTAAHPIVVADRRHLGHQSRPAGRRADRRQSARPRAPASRRQAANSGWPRSLRAWCSATRRGSRSAAMSARIFPGSPPAACTAGSGSLPRLRARSSAFRCATAWDCKA